MIVVVSGIMLDVEVAMMLVDSWLSATTSISSFVVVLVNVVDNGVVAVDVVGVVDVVDVVVEVIVGVVNVTFSSFFFWSSVFFSLGKADDDNNNK